MPDPGSYILARAMGRDILLEASQLLEVLPAVPVRPLPGPVPGISGVILHQGEFLPVLDWAGLPGTPGQVVWATALAVLKRRLALPLESLDGVLDSVGESSGFGVADGDPWEEIVACICPVGEARFPLLDADKLVAWLHHQRARH